MEVEGAMRGCVWVGQGEEIQQAKWGEEVKKNKQKGTGSVREKKER